MECPFSLIPEFLPTLRLIFEEDIRQQHAVTPDEKKRLEKELILNRGREKAGLNEYMYGLVRQEVWRSIAAELSSQRMLILRALENLEQSHEIILTDLEIAIETLAQMSELYATLSEEAQHHLLRLVVQKIVVDEQGTILRVELQAPFAYIHSRYAWLKKIIASKAIENATSLRGGVPKRSRKGSFELSFSCNYL